MRALLATGTAALLAFEGRPLAISARRREQALELIDQLDIAASVVPWGKGSADALIVNATSIGMAGEALPLTDLASHSGLLDMPYATGTTPAAVEMRHAGRPVAEGPDMLLGQAAASFRLWTGMEPDTTAMRQAMIEAAGGDTGL